MFGDYLRLTLLYVHVLSFSMALALVLREDWRILVGEVLNPQEIALTARRTHRLLLALWISGLIIIIYDTHLDLQVLASRPKLLAKVLCISVLSVNGYFLHHRGFPVLIAREPLLLKEARMLSLTGAVSTSNWLLAAFIGIARPLNEIPFSRLSNLYLMFMAGVAAVAWLVAPALQQHLNRQRANRQLQCMGISTSPVPTRSAGLVGQLRGLVGDRNV